MIRQTVCFELLCAVYAVFLSFLFLPALPGMDAQSSAPLCQAPHSICAQHILLSRCHGAVCPPHDVTEQVILHIMSQQGLFGLCPRALWRLCPSGAVEPLSKRERSWLHANLSGTRMYMGKAAMRDTVVLTWLVKQQFTTKGSPWASRSSCSEVIYESIPHCCAPSHCLAIKPALVPPGEGLPHGGQLCGCL